MASAGLTSEIVDAFHEIRRTSPDRRLVFLPSADAALTASDLWDQALALSALLDRARVGRRGLIVAVLGNRPAYLATFLACRMRQQPLCPLDASTTASEIGAIGLQLGASAVLTVASVALSPIVDQPASSRWHAAASAPGGPGITVWVPDRDPGDSRHGDAVLLKMTSGSSGVPRATLTPEAALMIDSRALMAAMRVGANDIQFAAIPLSHAYGIGNIVMPLFIQGTAIVMRDAFVPHRLADDARRYGATVFPGVPFMFDHFVKNPPGGDWPPMLRNLLSAGALLETGVAEAFRQRFGVKIHPFYGTSETGGITYDATDSPATDGLVGTPLPGVSLEMVPEDGAPEGGGRVLVRGPAVIRAYADTVDPDSFVNGGFLTGDLGTVDGAGQLTLAGRVSSFVNVAGRKVQPEEVERVLRAHEAIADVRVLGISDERRGEQLAACVVVRGARPSLLALRQFCAARLASHKIPRAFVFLDRIPLTERGKTDRIGLRDAVTAALGGDTDML
jgi:acyl-CoA synthetase (AMP-forming)/AMP-acid ligase II